MSNTSGEIRKAHKIWFMIYDYLNFEDFFAQPHSLSKSYLTVFCPTNTKCKEEKLEGYNFHSFSLLQPKNKLQN
jgi:hypothetical protein